MRAKFAFFTEWKERLNLMHFDFSRVHWEVIWCVRRACTLSRPVLTSYLKCRHRRQRLDRAYGQRHWRRLSRVRRQGAQDSHRFSGEKKRIRNEFWSQTRIQNPTITKTKSLEKNPNNIEFIFSDLSARSGMCEVWSEHDELMSVTSTAKETWAESRTTFPIQSLH